VEGTPSLSAAAEFEKEGIAIRAPHWVMAWQERTETLTVPWLSVAIFTLKVSSPAAEGGSIPNFTGESPSDATSNKAFSKALSWEIK
jgi:hypothetical protein